MPEVDSDEDGATNQEEADAASDPTNPDSDNDTVLDGEDGWARVQGYSPRRLPIPQFAIVDLGENAYPRAVNDLGMVVIQRGGALSFRDVDGQETAIQPPDDYLLQLEPSNAVWINQAGGVLLRLQPRDFQSSEITTLTPLLGDPEITYAFTERSSAQRPLFWTKQGGFTQLGPLGSLARFSRSWLENDYCEGGTHEKEFSPIDMSPSGSIVGELYDYSYCALYSPTAWEEEIRYAWDTATGRLGNYLVNANRDGALAYLNVTPDANYEVLLKHEYFEPVAISDNNISVGKVTLAPAGEGWSYDFSEPENQEITAAAYSQGGLIHALAGIETIQGITPANHILGKSGNQRVLVMDSAAGPKLDQPTSATPSYSEPLMWDDAMGAPPPDKLNTRLQGFSPFYNGFLWQNAKWYPLKTSATWTDTSVTCMSRDGIFAGVAKNEASWNFHGVLLVPAEIEIKKVGTDKAPKDGLVVLKDDAVEIKLNDIPQENMPVAAENIKWYRKQLQSDGSYTDWIDMGASARGVKFNYTCDTPGIFEIKCEMTIGAQTVTVIFDRDRDELKTSNGYMGPGRKGQPDALGVCATQAQINIRNEAKRFLGSPAYASTTPVPPEFGFSGFGTEGNAVIRCNIFVAHRCCTVGAIVPAINGNGITSFYPPLANQWAGIQNCRPFPLNPIDISGPTYDIDYWSAASLVNPQPGFIMAHPIPDDAGHCAIVDYDGGGIGAGTSGTVNKNYPDFYDGTSRWRQYQP